MEIPQTTLGAPFDFAGVGLHTGAQCSVAVRPAPAGHGVQFLCGAGRIPARAEFVVNTRRCTCLGDGDCQVSTVEHLLAALFGMEVDNAEIQVQGPELPILDGSALPWAEAIAEVGVTRLGAPAVPIAISAPQALRLGDIWMTAVPAERFSVTCVTHFESPLLGTEVYEYRQEPASFLRDVAAARTFGFAAEVDALLAAGLARGGSLDNAIVVYDDHFSQPLRLPNECLRHKVLDLLGDLSLAGGRLQCAVTAIKPSHTANTRFASQLRGHAEPEGGGG